jgi:hypothetical protein
MLVPLLLPFNITRPPHSGTAFAEGYEAAGRATGGNQGPVKGRWSLGRLRDSY